MGSGPFPVRGGSFKIWEGGPMDAYLLLENGAEFHGCFIGPERELISEIVFNTSMSGYLELVTDPSYTGQTP